MTGPATQYPRILPFGDCALLVEFDDQMSREVSERILALRDRVARDDLPGLIETVPTYRSLLVRYDPLQTRFADLSSKLDGFLEHQELAARTPRHWEIPVCYEPEHAPDLDWVAETLGMTPDEVVRLQTGVTYHIYMIGFVAGYPYVGDLPEQLSLPRRADPRVRVPKGSLGIALTMAAIYPVVSPGGWHLIGQTPIKLFDPALEEPALLRPGDSLKFKPISHDEFCSLEESVDAGQFQLEPDLAAA